MWSSSAHLLKRTWTVLFVVFCVSWSYARAGRGEVQVLTEETMETSLGSGGTWLVSFYAPWCHHCKKLEPVLDEVAKIAGSDFEEISIGKMDATRNQKAAEIFHIDRFPTILYKKEGFSGRYEGPRTKEGLLHFVQRMHAPAFTDITSPAELRHGLQTLHNVTFVLSLPAHCRGDDHAALSSSCSESIQKINTHFVDIAKEEQFHIAFARLFFTENGDDDNNSKNAVSLCKYESTVLQEDLLYCLDDVFVQQPTRAVLHDFVVKNNYPVVSTFENHNFKVFSHLNKTMVIAIVDYSKSYASAVIDSLETLARRIPSQHRSEYIFGHLDGIKWTTFIRHHEGRTPSMLVVDHDDGRHADLPIAISSPDAISQSLESFFQQLIHQELIFRETIPPTLWQKMKHRFETYYPWSLVLVGLPVLLFAAAIFIPYPEVKKAKQH